VYGEQVVLKMELKNDHRMREVENVVWEGEVCGKMVRIVGSGIDNWRGEVFDGEWKLGSMEIISMAYMVAFWEGR
jgi:hypothetical protein